MTRNRKLGALTLALPLAVGIVAFGPSSTAQAEGSGIKSPANKAVITKGSTTTVSAHLDLLAVGKLFIDPPGSSGEQQIASGTGPKDISKAVSISRNGVYVVKLKGLVGQTIDQQTFSVRVPPARPSGVDAGLSGHKLIVRWERGRESDLTGYDVFVDGNRARRGSTGALCGEDVCSTALSVPASGGRVPVAVRAYRTNGAGGTVGSALSTATVLLPASSAPSARGLPGLPPRSASPLLPLQGQSPLTLPTVAPNGATPGFQYPAPAPQVANPAAGDPNAQNASSTSPLAWGKSVAVALILLVIAAHLGMWTRRMRLAQSAAGAEPSPKGSKDAPSPKGGNREVKTAEAPPATASSTVPAARPAQPGDRTAVWPPKGTLIDAKRPVADPAILGTEASPTPSASDQTGEPASARAMASQTAGAAPRTTQEVKARAQRPKAKRSTRHSSGYRGRRRAD